MAKEEVFRWRTNPNVIARYILDKHVPDGSRVTLKPNEACAILEQGRVVGVATQTEMEVNPKLGTLSRIFGKKSPSRAYLFALLGPHEIMLKLEGRTSDNHDVKGIAFVRASIDREAVPRLLQLPAKGRTEVTAGDLAARMEMEASQKVASEIIANVDLATLRSDPDIDKDVEATLKIGLRATMESLGMSMEAVWCTWNDTEADKILSMRAELENMVAKNEVMDAMQAEDAQRIINTKLRQIELQHSMQVADMSAQAKQAVAAELAQMAAQKDVDQARWDTIRAQELRNIDHAQEKAAMVRQEEVQATAHEMQMASMNIEKESQVADFERSQRQKDFDMDNLQTQTALDTEHQEQLRQVEIQQHQEDTKSERAMDMFAQVQEQKSKRLEQQAEREQQRLGVQTEMSDKMVETLGQIASGSDSSEVSLEALKQLSELRKQDVQASSEAYVKDEASKGEDENPKV
jgi:hypothetical protein